MLRSDMMRGLTLAMVLAIAPSASAVSPDERDPRKIMEAVEGRDLGDRTVARFVMTLSDASGRERQREVRTTTMTHDGARRSLLFFESPAEVRNTGLFSIDWDDRTKAADQWLFLPAVGKPSRIAGADRSGSFLGTDLSYSDMTRKDPDRYDYELIEASVEVGGEDCWLIEATPRTAEERAETGYVKSRLWLSKAKLIPIQTMSWVAKGKRIKKIRMSEIERVDGIWTPKRLVVQTERRGKPESTTVLTWRSIAHGQAEVTPDTFSVRRLEQGL